MLFIVVYFSLVILLLLRLSDAFISRESKIMNSAHVKALANLQEALVAYREVFVSQQSGNIVSSVTQNLDESIRARAQLTWVGLLPKYILDTSVILGISIIGTFAYVIYSPGEALTLVGLFLLCASRIMPSFLRLNTGLQGIQNCSDASNRLRSFVLELSNFETKDRIGEDYSPLEDGDGDGVFIAVDSLRFKYPDSKALVIQDLSFEVKQGEFLAIVGQSGSGKSTLVDILMGVLDDPSGSVEIGGLPPRVRIEGKPGLISYVPQSVSLFHRSLLENIALGVPSSEIDLDKVQAAVERAALADLVDSLPLGLSTIVGENGHNFSGGQKQRIGLARAFYSNPQILILDEATSSLDAETEHQISQMLVSLSGELTLIVVAHRLATVQKADKVLYLGGSGFSTVGSFEDLRIRVPNFDVQAKLLGL
jgi:ABC-type multidrug transport system fused ATPase/permease subunit